MKQKPMICILNITFEGLGLYVCGIRIADCGRLYSARGNVTPTTQPVAGLGKGKRKTDCRVHSSPVLSKRVRLFQDEIASSLNQILLPQPVSSFTI